MAVPNFIAKSNTTAAQCLRVDSRPVVEQYAILRDAVIAQRGRPTASLFAEPILSRKDDVLEIAWYSGYPGAPAPLKALDADARIVVIERLKERLSALAPDLDDATLGPLLARALYIQSADDIFALGQEPVLINWGIVPAGTALDDQQALDRHFTSTLGPYASFGPPRLVGARPTSAIDPASPSTLVRRPAAFDVRGLLVATGVAAALTLLLNLPGVLAYPLASLVGGNSDAALEAQRAVTKAMREKIEAATAALKAATCNLDGTLKINLPVGGGAELAPKQIPATPRPGDVQGDMNHVADVATQSVVFVIAFSKEDTQSANRKSDDPAIPTGGPFESGSGFFIGPKTIVTNAHVIDGAETVYVTNHFLGKLQKATVKYRTGALRLFDPDFAVLETDTENSPPAVPLSVGAARLMNVVSAGFPGIVNAWDPEFEKLRRGDLSAAPEVTTFPGFVTLIQDGDGALPRIVHSATIGHGNSGGPLLDLCGRAIGVNTLINTRDGDEGYIVSNALATKGLMAFLDANHVAYQRADDACAPATSTPTTAKLPDSGSGKSAPGPGDSAPTPLLEQK